MNYPNFYEVVKKLRVQFSGGKSTLKVEKLFTLQRLVKYQVITIVRFYHKTNSDIPLTSAPSLTEVDKIRITWHIAQLQL